MTATDLKSCPSCGGPARWRNSVAVECVSEQCMVIGPRLDPDGAKWNALPRRGTGKEMEELRAARSSWNPVWGDAASGAVRIRHAIDAVLAAATCNTFTNLCCQKFDECREPCVERGRHQRDAEVKQLTEERDALRAKLAAAPRVETSPSGEEFARMERRLSNQIDILRSERDSARRRCEFFVRRHPELVWEIGQEEGGDGK